MDIEEPDYTKDDSEEELERLVFGDAAGFSKSVRDFKLGDDTGAGLDEDAEEEEVDLENVADQDLFFFDSGPGLPPALETADEDDEDEAEKPAWEDSDDERLTVSLLDRRQNIKLRETEEDDVIGGKDYIRRLRKQYQSLYPTPDWALYATNKSRRKRRRTNEDGDSESASGSDIDMDDSDDLSTQPLARLLKDADILDRNARDPAKRRKLQPGTVNIRRLSGIAQNGPVCGSPLSLEMLTNCFHSLQSHLSLSTPHIHSSSPPVPAQHYLYTI